MKEKNEKITVEVKGKEWEKALDDAFNKIAKDVNIDGFRKGHVPKDVYIEKRGIESLYDGACNLVLDSAYKDAMEKSTIKPEISPKIEVTDVNKDGITFEITIIGKPDVTLGKYKKLGIKKEEVSVSEEEINHTVEDLKKQYADIVIKENDVVESGDTVVIDYVGTIEGEAFEGGSATNYSLEIGSNTFIPGFEDGLIGMKSETSKDLNLKFPEGYPNDLGGKDVVFHVTVHEVKTKIYPELNEDFFMDLGMDEGTTVDEFYKEVKKNILEEKEKNADNLFLDEVIKKAIDNMEVEIPKEIIDEQIERQYHQLEEQVKQYGLTVEQVFAMQNMTYDDFVTQVTPEAEYRLKSRYLLEEVSTKENLEVSDEEVNTDIDAMVENYGITKEELVSAYGGMEVIKYDSLMRKTLKFLRDNN